MTTQRRPPLPALAIVSDTGRNARAPANPSADAYRSNAKWAKPMPRAHKNWIPQTNGWFGYQWQDRDPEMDFVLHAIEESGRTLEWIERETESHGHKVSRYTLLGWFYKGVKRPQNATMNSVMAAIGWEREWRQAG
jgi:hypothetical protein